MRGIDEAAHRPYSPTPFEIVAKREAAGLTQTQAGALIYASRRTFQDWEHGKRHMDPRTWEYFCLLVDYPEVMAARAHLLETRASPNEVHACP